MVQTRFERLEKKYMLTGAQMSAFERAIAGRMQADAYGAYTVANLYYDTDAYDLIRASIEKPVYKEKLRLRCYGQPGPRTPLFLELKKKYKGIVYKRRIKLSLAEISSIRKDGLYALGNAQVLNEIRYFLSLYPVSEKALICYDRRALCGVEDEALRVTFDTDIRFRDTELRLDRGFWGRDILEPGKTLMEIKIPGAFPLWMSRALSECGIFPISYSKYGACYKRFLATGNACAGGMISA